MSDIITANNNFSLLCQNSRQLRSYLTIEASLNKLQTVVTTKKLITIFKFNNFIIKIFLIIEFVNIISKLTYPQFWRSL